MCNHVYIVVYYCHLSSFYIVSCFFIRLSLVLIFCTFWFYSYCISFRHEKDLGKISWPRPANLWQDWQVLRACSEDRDLFRGYRCRDFLSTSWQDVGNWSRHPQLGLGSEALHSFLVHSDGRTGRRSAIPRGGPVRSQHMVSNQLSCKIWFLCCPTKSLDPCSLQRASPTRSLYRTDCF